MTHREATATLGRLRGDREALEAFVEEGLRRALPVGWTAERLGRRWQVTVDRSGGWRCYEVLLDVDAFRLVVTHGNTDAGAIRLESLLLRATVIPLEGLPFVGMDLARCFAHIFASEPPNRWGLTLARAWLRAQFLRPSGGPPVRILFLRGMPSAIKVG